MNLTTFPHEFQMDAKDCGPASLMIIAKFYGKYYSLQYLRDLCGITREGVSFLDISYAADKIGLRTVSVKASMHDIVDRISLPCIIHWNANHFIVVYKASKTKILYQIRQKDSFLIHMKNLKINGIKKEKKQEY